MDRDPTVETGVTVPQESGLRDSIRVILNELLQEMNGSPETRKLREMYRQVGAPLGSVVEGH